MSHSPRLSGERAGREDWKGADRHSKTFMILEGLIITLAPSKEAAGRLYE